MNFFRVSLSALALTVFAVGSPDAAQVFYRGTSHEIIEASGTPPPGTTLSADASGISIRSNAVLSGAVNVSGGVAPYTFDFQESESPRPSWLQLNKLTGALSGIGVSGSWIVGIRVTDAAGTIADTSIQVSVAAPLVASLPSIATENGRLVSVTPMVTGGFEPYSFSWGTPEAERPSWLSLDDSTGRLSGTSSEGSWTKLRLLVADRDAGETLPVEFDVSSVAPVALASGTFPTSLRTSGTIGNSSGVGEYYSAAYTLFTNTHTWWMSTNGSNQYIELVYAKPIKFNSIDYSVYTDHVASLRYTISFTDVDGTVVSRQLSNNDLSSRKLSLDREYQTSSVRLTNNGTGFKVSQFRPGGISMNSFESTRKVNVSVDDRVSVSDLFATLPAGWEDMHMVFRSSADSTLVPTTRNGKEIIFNRKVAKSTWIVVHLYPKSGSTIWRRADIELIPN